MVEVPSQEVLDGILEVRDSGVTNMFVVFMVKSEALRRKRVETYNWIEQNPEDYIRGIFKGFKVKE